MSKKKELVPKRRFKEFENAPAWKQRKLGDVGQTFTGLSGKTKKDFGHGNANYVTYLNVFNNTITDKTDLDQIEIDPNQNSVSYGDVFFTTSSETPEEVGMSSVWLENTENIYLNSFCFGYRPREIFDSFFLAYLLRSPSLRKQFTLLAQGISRYNISKTKAMEIVIDIPTLNEQNYIGELFFNIDNLITRHQRKLEKMKELKKSYLSEMFPAEGERKPKRRFAGFTDDWEQRKFGDFFDPIPNNSLSRAKLNYLSGKIKNIHYGDILINYGDILKYDDQKIPYITDPRLTDYYNQLLKDGDIIIADAAEDHSVGKAIEITGVNQNYIVAGLHTIACRPRENVHPRFMGYLMNSSAYQNQLLTIMQGIKVFSVSRANLADTVLYMPSENLEQGKIASLFCTLDDLITLHQRKLEKLKNIKKAYLNEMFPRTERE